MLTGKHIVHDVYVFTKNAKDTPEWLSEGQKYGVSCTSIPHRSVEE